jgi:hypothetical protein
MSKRIFDLDPTHTKNSPDDKMSRNSNGSFKSSEGMAEGGDCEPGDWAVKTFKGGKSSWDSNPGFNGDESDEVESWEGQHDDTEGWA